MSESATTVSYAAKHQTSHEEHGHHVVPLILLFGVWAALMVLTVITVIVARPELKAAVATFANVNPIDISRFSLILAMVIATVKATIVAMYFMHLKYDRPINAIVFLISVLFLGLFIVISMLDSQTYRDEPLRQSVETSAAPDALKAKQDFEAKQAEQNANSGGTPAPDGGH